MHVFLLNLPRLEFAAMIPKGDYVSMCLLGEDIDTELVEAFLAAPEVRQVMPREWRPEQRSCQCQPRINVRGVRAPYADRVLFIGDCGVTRLYKDGIGAAYRTAKAAARTVIFEGVSAKVFERHYLPTCRRIEKDNLIGKLTFAFTRQIQKRRIARHAVLRMTEKEQASRDYRPRMSSVLWDMFSGSAPYADIFRRTLHPVFLARLSWCFLRSLWPGRKSSRRARPSEDGSSEVLTR
jgi:hypothetical protein